MNQQKAKKSLGFPKGIPRPTPKAVALVVGIAVFALALAVTLLMMKHDRDIRKYSGAETDSREQLNYDVSALEEYIDKGADIHADGTYSRHIILKKEADLRLWRDRERHRLPLREQIKEKYPSPAHFSTLSTEGHSDHISEKCRFEADGRSHTAALIRRGGWDYLIDLSVAGKKRDAYAGYFDRVLDGIFFL